MNYSQKDFTSSPPSNSKMESWAIDEKSAKYRNIPVFQTSGDFKSSNIYCENVSGVKEMEKNSRTLKGDTYHVKSASILDTEGKAGINKKRTKLDSAMSVHALQLKPYADHSFVDRMGQGSVSEPTLCNAKDRGDSNNIQDFYREDNSLSYKCFGDGKTKTTKDRGIRGCVYLKSGGKVYKSAIDTTNLQVAEDTHFDSLGTRQKKDNKDSVPWSKLDRISKAYGPNDAKCSKEELDDFDIAIVLSGVRNISEKSQKKQGKLADNRTKEERKPKRKKKNPRKNETTVVPNKKFEMKSEIYHVPRKMLSIDPYSSKRFLNEKIAKARIQLRCSSGSESEYILELPDKGSNSMKRLRNTTTIRAIAAPNENRDMAYNYKSKSNEIVSYRSKGTPQLSYYQISDAFRAHKRKVCDGELWEKFGTIFRNYASTTLHSGEVIPRKISTEWMTNAGVVDEILTEKEADHAFRQAAGAKITMNAQEYKEFLIMLTLRMKLPYYEIYRRMCGI